MKFFNRDKEKGDVSSSPEPSQPGELDEGIVTDNADQLQRHLANRQIQLIAIGGSIGTALFVSIGNGLYRGGPGSLLIAYTIESCFLAMVNNCVAEMNTAFPVSGGFIRLAGKWVDDALGFMVGWNFLLAISALCIANTTNVCQFLRSPSYPIRDFCFHPCDIFLESYNSRAWPDRWYRDWSHHLLRVSTTYFPYFQSVKARCRKHFHECALNVI